MTKSLYDERYKPTVDGDLIDREVSAFARHILDEYFVRRGYSPREISSIAIRVFGIVESEYVLRSMVGRLPKRELTDVQKKQVAEIMGIDNSEPGC